jgi:predicted DNA binding CopG/RHH family protein
MRKIGNCEIFTISLPSDVAAKVKQEARKKRLNYSAFIRMVLAENLFKEDQNAT